MSLSLLVLLFSECKQDNQKSFNSKKSSRKEESLQLSTNSNNFMRKMKFLSKNHLCNMNLQVETQQKEKEDIQDYWQNNNRLAKLFIYSPSCIWWYCPLLENDPVVILDNEPPRLICSNSSDTLSAISCDLLNR